MKLNAALLFLLLPPALSIDFTSSYVCQDPHYLLDYNGLNHPIVPFDKVSDATADCRALLSHLPTSHGHTPSANAPISSSLPFLPHGQLSHGSCQLRFVGYRSHMPLGSASLMPWQPVHRAAASPPPEEHGIVQEWSEIHAVAHDIVTHYLENESGGFGLVASPWSEVKVIIGPGLDSDASWATRLRVQRDLLVRSPDTTSLRRWPTWGWGIYEV